MTTNFLIGPVDQALRKDLKPWATPENSFETMINAYQFRGRVVRRQGYTTLGQLANGTPVMGLRTQEGFNLDVQNLIAFDTTQAYSYNGTNFVALPSTMPVVWSGTDYQFFWTINYAGAFWATNSKPGLNGVRISNAVAGGGITTITTTIAHGFTSGQSVAIINITSTATGGVDDLNGNVYVITVTGPTTFTIPFATADTYVSGGIALNSQVSIVGQDGIRYYGTMTGGIVTWVNYNPPVDPNNALVGCLLMFAYRGYLVLLNTTEGNEAGTFNYGNRARWTQIGTPYYSEPVPSIPNPQTVDPFAARDDLFGRGGANDAPTNEVIIGANFIRDVLVVYFERSTWRLRFVNNAQNPFVWERVNVELGCSCTFSTIPFDKGLMAISNRGIVISDGNDTIRIDEKIPDDFFNIRQTNHGLYRVNGIRTFRTKLCYWTFPSTERNGAIYPDKVLIYNYETKNWSYYDDSFTCFGYYYPQSVGFRWEDLTEDWSSYETISWNSGVSEAGYENIVAGNQQGYVFLLEQNIQNSPSLTITAVSSPNFTSPNHNLVTGDWIKLTGVTGITLDDGVSLNGRNFRVANPTLNANTFTLTEFAPITAPNASGTAYLYTISYQSLVPGSIQINVGALVFTDPTATGVLVEASGLGLGNINYTTGVINLVFIPSISSTSVIIRIVSLDPEQGFEYPVFISGVYTGGGQITKISGYDVQTKVFNFFKDDQRTRLSKVDFYLDSTTQGQFTMNVFGDGSNEIINVPLPDNAFSNVVTTYPTQYQIGTGNQVISRIYADCLAQTFQLQFTLSDYQLATDYIANSNIEILAMIIGMRRGGRLI